ncbi:hypothetical protein Ahy_B09g097734 isoform B [Arachis hypogaea]|uniref:Uncharacterized protein n=2 Tax=Arachis hypogaea TaxID=3818 RepID=A0A444XPR4_ARAHY|nr:hypothetical protein Ahy_B09g097734 isoform B [Arachis hypogaea]
MFVASSHPIGRSRRLPLTASRRSRGLSLLQSSSTSTWLQIERKCLFMNDAIAAFGSAIASSSQHRTSAACTTATGFCCCHHRQRLLLLFYFSLVAKLVARCSACSPWPPFEEAANGVVIATEKTLPSILVEEASVQKIQLLTPNIGVV